MAKLTWTSVKDKLPEKDGEYIVAYERDDNCEFIVTALPFSTECGFVEESSDGGFWEADYVEYWMPLPEAPQKKGK